MKVKKKSIIIFLLLIVLIVFSIDVLKMSSEKENKGLKVEKINESSDRKISIKKITYVYVDDNPIKIGIYRKSTRQLLTEYSSSWKPEEIIGIFSVFATTDNTISKNSFDTVWKSYWNKQEKAAEYKIGYNISFTLNDGTKVDRTILNPLEATYMFPKVMFFVYDDVNLIPGRAYSHVTQEEWNDKTLLTTVKLVGDVETKNIEGKIKLTAFTYKNKRDFDPKTGKYRGNSYYTININKS